MKEQIRPYPRKWENVTMTMIKQITLISSPSGPPCDVNRNAPGLVFSAGEYTINFFHDFNDGFILLFISVNSLFPSAYGDLVLVIEKSRDWWLTKYADLLRTFTLISSPSGPPCDVSHNAPGLVFSAGEYTRNLFHDFNDGFTPLFISVNSLFPSAYGDLVLVIGDFPNTQISSAPSQSSTSITILPPIVLYPFSWA
ncbi:hypothetical protein Nepgr_003613 [Nepenthes gracilis]|uniref:Uncharacterized protein n=1 Tax=Nepenthes gracilis TaxID=150966 RepID=A0AAD3RZZ7_NEPGR|nr:hypothetical protein Nepgr_003613 [Nepenthes gracilis]